MEKKHYEAGPNAVLVIDELERERWESIGVVGEEAQDKVFRVMAKAVANLTDDEDIEWSPASRLLIHDGEPRPTDS